MGDIAELLQRSPLLDRRAAGLSVNILQRQFKQTMVYVTHDQLEAMTMAARIAVMVHGKLLQVVPAKVVILNQ